MLGKSVLPRVLVRVTLLLPAHLPVLIGQRVSHSGGCRLVLAVYVSSRAREHLHTPLTLTYVNLKAGISMEVCMYVCVSRATLTH